MWYLLRSNSVVLSNDFETNPSSVSEKVLATVAKCLSWSNFMLPICACNYWIFFEMAGIALVGWLVRLLRLLNRTSSDWYWVVKKKVFLCVRNVWQSLLIYLINYESTIRNIIATNGWSTIARRISKKLASHSIIDYKCKIIHKIDINCSAIISIIVHSF